MARLKNQVKGNIITSLMLRILALLVIFALLIFLPFNASASIFDDFVISILSKDIALSIQAAQMSPGHLDLAYPYSLEEFVIEIKEDEVLLNNPTRIHSKKFIKLENIEIIKTGRIDYLTLPIILRDNTLSFTSSQYVSCSNILIQSSDTLRVRVIAKNNEQKTTTLKNNLIELINNEPRIRQTSQDPHIILELEFTEQETYSIRYFSSGETNFYRRLNCELQEELEEYSGISLGSNEEVLQLSVNFTDSTKIMNALRRLI